MLQYQEDACKNVDSFASAAVDSCYIAEDSSLCGNNSYKDHMNMDMDLLNHIGFVSKRLLIFVF